MQRFASAAIVALLLPAGLLLFAQNGPNPIGPPRIGQPAPKEIGQPAPKPSSPAAPGEPNLEPPADQPFTIVERVNRVVAPTTVLDTDGAYVTGLNPSDFRLWDNGKQQDITVDETLWPVSLVVAIQADAKVEAVLPKVKKIGTVLQNMVAGEHGEVAIVSFDHRIQTLQDFTNDSDKVTAALSKLSPGSSNSRMIDAITHSTRMLRTRPKDHRRVILLISESRDKSSEGRVRDALTATEVENVMIYALNISRVYTELTAKPPLPRPDPIPPGARHMPAGAAITPTAVAQMTGSQGYGMNFVPLITEIFRSVKAIFIDNPVEVFTRYTGGKENGFVSQNDLDRALADIGREIHNQYLISYNPTPETRMDGGFHNIQVEVLRKGLEVRTRPGYWMAATR